MRAKFSSGRIRGGAPGTPRGKGCCALVAKPRALGVVDSTIRAAHPAPPRTGSNSDQSQQVRNTTPAGQSQRHLRGSDFSLKNAESKNARGSARSRHYFAKTSTNRGLTNRSGLDRLARWRRCPVWRRQPYATRGGSKISDRRETHHGNLQIA